MRSPLPNTDVSVLALAVLSLELFYIRLQLVEMVNAMVGNADGADGVLTQQEAAVPP